MNHVYAHTNKEDKHSIGNKMADKLANQAIGYDKCPYEKVFINITYNNKEEAKKLGAKWDLNKKSWYYDDKITEENKYKLNLLEKNNKVANVININKNYIDISYSKKNLAKSYGAKWDSVVKKWFYLDTLEEENIIKLKNL